MKSGAQKTRLVWTLVSSGLITIISACSNVHEGTVLAPPPLTGVAYYFPLTENYSATYQEEKPNGLIDQVNVSVGDEIEIQGYHGRQWIFNSDNERDTAFFVETASQLLYFASANSSPEKVLSLPLQAGRSWSRFESNIFDELDDNDDVIIDDGGYYDDFGGDLGTGDTTTSGGGEDPLMSSFPTNGGNTMTVVTIETVELSNGKSYGGAAKIMNVGDNGLNYYWFAPGVGLVKYVIGTSGDGSQGGNLVGELSEYSR